MNLEPLRELERKWLRTADEYTAQGDNADDDDERAWAHGRSEAYASAAEELSRALAQLDDGWRGVIGEVVEIGDDDEGQPRILIHTTREAIKNGPPLAFRTVRVAAMRQ